MSGPDSDGIASLFLDGADAVAGALADPAVAAAWDRPSVLEEQSVGALAGHLSRSGVWVVAEYLAAGAPTGPADLGSAGEYYATFVSAASPADHRAIRERGAAVASDGPEALLLTLDERLGELRERLAMLDGDQLIIVAGSHVMRLADSLTTRIVEQMVHLDDLARSLGREPWPVPRAAIDLTLAVGVEIGARRRGETAMMRTLFREGFAEGIVPVI